MYAYPVSNLNWFPTESKSCSCEDSTHGSILGGLGLATLERQSVALVLESLGGNETLNTWGFGVWLLALSLWLNFTTNDEFANLEGRYCID